MTWQILRINCNFPAPSPEHRDGSKRDPIPSRTEAQRPGSGQTEGETDQSAEWQETGSWAHGNACGLCIGRGE